MPRLDGLQALRAFAALLVLIGHVIAEAEHYFGVSLPGEAIPWTRGVDIFFVISGFIITLSAHRSIGQPVAFLWRRFLRVAPIYYLFTTLMVATLLILPGAAKDTNLDAGQIINSYLFLPYAREDGRIAPVLSLGWTLNYEMFFYALFAGALALPRPVYWISGALVALVLAGLIHPSGNTALTFWTNPIILEFCFGILLAQAWISGWVRPDTRLALVVFLIGIALLILLDPTPLPRVLAAGIPAVLITASGTIFFPANALLGLAAWRAMGDAAYALYLSHRFTLRAATLLLVPLLPATPLAACGFVAFVCGLSIAVALLTYRFVELPLLRTLYRDPRQRVIA